MLILKGYHFILHSLSCCPWFAPRFAHVAYLNRNYNDYTRAIQRLAWRFFDPAGPKDNFLKWKHRPSNLQCNYNKRLALLRLKVSKRETNILSPESGNFRLVHISLHSLAEKPNKSLAYRCKVGQKSNPSSKIKVCTCCFLRFIVLFFCPLPPSIKKWRII